MSTIRRNDAARPGTALLVALFSVLWAPAIAAARDGIGLKIGKISPPSLGGSYCEMMLYVRNGLESAIAGLAFDLTLFDPDGFELAHTDYRVENLAAGRIRRQAFGIPVTQFQRHAGRDELTDNAICLAPVTAEIRVLACALGADTPPDACLEALYEEPGGDLRLSFLAAAEDPQITYEIIKPFPRTTPTPTAPITAERAHIARLGMTLATLTAEVAVSHGIAFSKRGLVVVGIDAAGPGARSDVQIGDVVQEIDQDTVGAPGDIAGTLANAAGPKRRSHLVLLHRAGEALFRVITVEGPPIPTR